MVENKNEFETIDFEEPITPEKKDLSQKDLSKNIFSDFDTDSSIKEEIGKIKEKEGKDTFHYLLIVLRTLEILFVLLFLGIILGYTYTYIQKSESFINKEYLNPICGVLNSEVGLNGSGCSSIAANKQSIQADLDNLYKSQSKLILSVLPVIYERENFLKTKEISFLLDKTSNKLKVLDILEKFEYFKNDFTGYEKKKLICYDLNIVSKDKTLTMKCDAFAKGYTSEIIGFSGNKNIKEESLSGTSISVANSFINFLEKNATKYFTVIDRQKVFEAKQIIGTDGYTNQTTFNLKLKINF